MNQNLAPLIYGKMSDVMKDIGAIGKSQTNSAQGFKFRGVDQFVNALYPALTKAGVFMTPRVTSMEAHRHDVVRANGKSGVDSVVRLLVEYDFYAEDGSKVTVGPVAGEGLDSGDKATTKALSAALKYMLIQTFVVPTVDMTDQDSDSPELGTKVASVVGAKESAAAKPVEVKTSAPETLTATVQDAVKLAVPAPFKRTRPTQTKTSSNEDVI